MQCYGQRRLKSGKTFNPRIAKIKYPQITQISGVGWCSRVWKSRRLCGKRQILTEGKSQSFGGLRRTVLTAIEKRPLLSDQALLAIWSESTPSNEICVICGYLLRDLWTRSASRF